MWIAFLAEHPNQAKASRLVFDVAQNGYNTWKAALVPAACALVLFVLFVLVRRHTTPRQQSENMFYDRLLLVSGALSVLATLGLLGYTWSEYSGLRRALRRGSFQVVEGVIQDLVPERPDGHPVEQFRVGSTRFAYSSSDITSAFHWTVGRGGPVRNGLRVKIVDVGGKIARLEIETMPGEHNFAAERH